LCRPAAYNIDNVTVGDREWALNEFEDNPSRPSGPITVGAGERIVVVTWNSDLGPPPSPAGAAPSRGASAQTGFNGKWLVTETGLNRLGAPTPRQEVTMELKNENGAVTGFVTRTTQRFPLEGRATETSIEFTARTPNNRGTITFRGTLKGNQIQFTREAQGTGDGTGVFGENGPATLTVQRAN
jgi:hypothetical protein